MSQSRTLRKMYTFPLAEVMGKQTGRSTEIIPFRSKHFISFTPIECFLSMLPNSGYSGGSCSISSSIIWSIVTFVDGLMHFLIQCMRPMTVIGDFGRCFCTSVVVNHVQLLKKSFAIAFIHVVGGMLPTHPWR